VYEFSRAVAPEMFVEVVDGFASGSISPRPQPDDPSAALRCYPRLPVDSRLDWRDPAPKLDRIVRATAEPLPGAYTFLGTERVTVWRSHAEEADTPHLGTPGQVAERRPDDGTVVVVTGDGFLALETVETATHGRTEATDVITSHRDRLGMHAPEELSELVTRVERLEEQADNPSE